MGSKKLWAGIAVALAAASLGVPAFAASAANCPTSALAPASKSTSALHVVSLSATGISCARAMSTVAPLVKDVADGKSVSVAGAAGVSLVQSAVNGSTTTHVKLTYPNGSQIDVAMKGRVKSASGNETLPNLPAFPNFPNFFTPGSSSSTVV